MDPRARVIHHTTRRSVAAENSVLRSTYMLLGMSLLWSAAMAIVSLIVNKPPTPLIDLIGMWGLLFLVQANAHTSLGVLFTFLFTGFIGFTLGPLLGLVLYSVPQGSALLALTLATTGIVFVAMSLYALTSEHSFSFLGGTLFAGIIAAIVLSLCGMFLGIPMYFLISSALMVLISSGLILFHTSEIVHGGEQNYVLATISLYVALYNLFVSMLHLMIHFSGNQRD